MIQPRRRIRRRSRHLPTAMTLALGLALGWGMAQRRPTLVKAGGSDRFGDYSLVAGPVAMQYNEANKTQSPQDAIYYLDYKGGRLLAVVPIIRKSLNGSKMIDGFIERDLIADFKIDLENAPTPHFLMTTGSLGAYGEGGAPLFVFETASKQVAVYKLNVQTTSVQTRSKFDLIEVKSYASLPPLPANPAP